MKILLATTNPHKLDEIRTVMRDPAIEWVTLDRLGVKLPEPVEDRDTFEGNALLKAEYYAQQTGLHALADDSGLEVDYLDKAPGVLSARYAGKQGPREVVDAANNRLVLEKMRGVAIDKRTARFVCAMAFVSPKEDKPIAQVRGTVEGRLLTIDEADDSAAPHKGRGTNGFGYDPIFYMPGLNQTTAELPPEHKNRVSHRGQALRMMWREIALWLRSHPE